GASLTIRGSGPMRGTSVMLDRTLSIEAGISPFSRREDLDYGGTLNINGATVILSTDGEIENFANVIIGLEGAQGGIIADTRPNTLPGKLVNYSRARLKFTEENGSYTISSSFVNTGWVSFPDDISNPQLYTLTLKGGGSDDEGT